MKKQALASIAERLYVADQWTFESIGKELGVSERSVRKWAQDGKWSDKRAALIAERTTLEQDLVGFTRKLVALIDMDLDRLSSAESTDPDRDQRIESRINAVTRLLGRLPQTREYEKKVRQEQQTAAKDAQKAPSGDEIADRVDAILGAR